MIFRKQFTVKAAMAALLLGTSAIVGASGALALDETHAPQAPAVAPPIGVLANGQHSLADIVAAVGPSVVQIRVRKHVDASPASMPFTDDGDMGEQMRRFFGFGLPGGPQPPASHEEGALGSGFIIDPSGIVLTNNHVVDGASDVTVQLSDGRELKGHVLGKDAKTDVAVVKIDGKGSFKAVQWGDSDRVRVGDSVFAVGSPFGLGNTVTAGIVSARSRDIGEGPYDDFLQVDAAINSGNSGGRSLTGPAMWSV